jgi:Pyridoxamine 5'-phosphate oxidase
MSGGRHADREPVSSEPMIAGATTPTPWTRARGHVEEATATYWLATVRPNGTPHVMPVLAVWANGGLFFCAGEGTRKARNFALDSRCVVTVEEEPLDLMVRQMTGSTQTTAATEERRWIAQRLV